MDGFGRANEEYVALLSRGATRGMCVRYHLEFTNATGIVAWADEELYDTYAGPEMRDGDFWKIYLGRRIELEEDDNDGSEFINDLLEEVLLFPLSLRVPERWETVEERPGIWATRPLVHRNAEEEEDEWDIKSVNSWEEGYAKQENIGNKFNIGPVKHYEDYDTVDDNASDVCEQEELPDDLAFLAGAPDAGYYPTIAGSEPVEVVEASAGIYDSWATHEVHESHEDAERPVEQSVSTPSTVTDDEASTVDEDFDSQEELSGDEDILRVGRARAGCQ